MSGLSNTQSVSEGHVDSVATLTATRPFFWSVRRELWEHRSIWIAPLVAAGLVLLGFSLRMLKLPELIRHAEQLPPLMQAGAIAAPFGIASGAIFVTGLIVGVFYCLGALGNERRDRSVLFWKSLPVSNLTTVLSKAFIPFFVLPLAVLTVTIATQLVMLLMGSAILLANGMSADIVWTHWPMLRMMAVQLYVTVICVLWYAPIYAWLLLVSSWARRVAFLWAVLPWLGLALLERIALDAGYVWSLIVYRFRGPVIEGFVDPRSLPKNMDVPDPLALLAPGHFLGAPGLWIGLLVATAFIAAAVWFRRMREPG